MRPVKPGVEVRATSIRIVFRYEGTQRRERLCVGSEALPPTPPNIKYARRVAAEVGDRIRLGTFKYADYFPDSPHAGNGRRQRRRPCCSTVMDLWLRVHDLKASTRVQYTRRLNSFWKLHLKNVPIDQVRYSDILDALVSGTWKSAKSRNNELSMIRGVFDLAKRDKHIAENPCDAIKRQEVQTKETRSVYARRGGPDPGAPEGEATGTDYNFVQFMFFTGLRTSEGLALRWKNIDFRSGEMHVEGGNVYDEESDTTKTSEARTVILSAPALAALGRQKAHTALTGDHVFHDPKTGEPWKYHTITDVRSFWEITLKKLGIRYRRPYNMRHTYATIGLMSGAKPGFLADQLGHSLRVFFEIYAKWISSRDDRAGDRKIECCYRAKNPQ